MEVLQPLPNSFVGPGLAIRAQTDFIGPIALGSFWEATVISLPEEKPIGTGRYVTQDALTTFHLGLAREQGGAFSGLLLLEEPGFSAWPSLASLVVVLKDPSNQILDQTSVPVKWNPTAAGVAWIQDQVPSSTVDGGFTETDRQQLQAIDTAVYASLPLNVAGGGLVQLGLDQLVKGPPVDLLAESTSFLISGRGSINRPSGTTGVYAYGLRWRIESAPAGLGQLDGQVVEYEQRIVQLVVVKTRLGGGEYAFEIDDSHVASGEMQWPVPFPVRVDFYVLPGVVLRCAWLLLLQ